MPGIVRRTDADCLGHTPIKWSPNVYAENILCTRCTDKRTCPKTPGQNNGKRKTFINNLAAQVAGDCLTNGHGQSKGARKTFIDGGS
jgi:hypothetical protein